MTDKTDQTPETRQCEICLDSPPYTECAGIKAPESASCVYIEDLERWLRAAESRLADERERERVLEDALRRITEICCSFSLWPVGAAHNIAKQALAAQPNVAVAKFDPNNEDGCPNDPDQAQKRSA